MTTLSKHARSPHSPSPIYGIRPGFTVADIERQYTPAIVAIGTTSSSVVRSIGTPIATGGARAVKITVNVTGAGSVTVTVYSEVDGYSAAIATYTGLTAGSYEFFLGGWSSPDSDGSSYLATQYGPVPPASEATSGLDPSDSSNYVGQTYNPFEFLSLDGYDLLFLSAVTGTVSYDVSFAPMG
jgi:hypothetical protein